MAPALRWAAMRAIYVLLNARGKVTRPCPQTTTSEERKTEDESNRGPSAYQPDALPRDQAGSQPYI